MHPGETSINNSDKDKTGQGSRKVCTLSPGGYILPVLLDKNLKGSLGENAKPLHNSHAQKPIRKKGPLRLRNGSPDLLHQDLSEFRLHRPPRDSPEVPLRSSSNHSPLHEQGTWGPTGMCPPMYLMPSLHTATTLEFPALRAVVQFGACAGFFPGLWRGWTLFPICAPPGPRWDRG